MKIAKFLKSSVGLVLMAVMLLSASACKKDNAKPEAKPALQGDWQELNLSTGFERLISFRSDKSFSMVLVHLEGSSEVISTYTGTYTLVNDNVQAKVTEEKVTKDRVLISTSTVDINLFDKGTYKVEDNVLTLKYITYPADAPVNTEAKFKKRLG